MQEEELKKARKRYRMKASNKWGRKIKRKIVREWNEDKKEGRKRNQRKKARKKERKERKKNGEKGNCNRYSRKIPTLTKIPKIKDFISAGLSKFYSGKFLIILMDLGIKNPTN